MDERLYEPPMAGGGEHARMSPVRGGVRIDSGGQYPSIWQAIGLHVLLSETGNAARWFLPMPVFAQQIFSELAKGGISSLIALAIIAPLNEEPLCRGLILTGFPRRYSARKAVLVSGLLFAVPDNRYLVLSQPMSSTQRLSEKSVTSVPSPSGRGLG